MARLFNGGELKKLEKVRGHFYTAVNLSYKNNTTKEENDMVADLYERVTGEKVNRNWACPKCTYDLFRKAGEIFFKSAGKDGKKQEETSEETV